MKESSIVGRAQRFLEKKRRCHIARQVGIGSEEVFEPRQKRKVDLVGLTGGGKIYVAECKAGTVRRPIHGLGQLLFYRALIEQNTNDFLRRLKDEKRLLKYRKQMENSSQIKFRYYLFVSPEDKAKFKKISSKGIFKHLERICGVKTQPLPVH